MHILFLLSFVSTLVIVGGWFFFDVLLPFLAGAVLAYLLNPLIAFLEQWHLFHKKRALVIMAVFLVLIGGFVYGSVFVFQSIQEGSLLTMIQDVSRYGEVVKAFFSRLSVRLEYLHVVLDPEMFVAPLIKELQGFVQQFVFSLKDLIYAVLNSAVFLIIMPLTAFYILKDKDRFLPACKKYMKERHFLNFQNALLLVHGQIGQYFKALILSSCIIALLVSVFLACFRQISSHALLLGTLAGITNIIPYFGPFISGIPIAIFAILELPSNYSVLIIVYLILVNGLVSFVIHPKLTSKSVNIHPLCVLIAIALGESLMGVLGMLLAVPIFICLKSCVQLLLQYYRKPRVR